jgi:vacuolar protein sorting-associated protein 35
MEDHKHVNNKIIYLEETTYKVLFDQVKELIETLQGTYAELSLKLYLNFLLCINSVD